MEATLAALGGGTFGGPPPQEAALPLPQRKPPKGYGSGEESRKQLATRKAHGYGGKKENANQREGCSRGGRKSLQQTNPVFYSGRATHAVCGKVVNIKEAVSNKPGVKKWCPHCQKTVYFGIKKYNLKVVKGKVVKRKR